MSDIAQYFAQLNDENIVIDIAVVTNAFMKKNAKRYPGRWVETFTDLPNKTYAGIGYTYDETTEDFIVPPPLPELTGK